MRKILVLTWLSLTMAVLASAQTPDRTVVPAATAAPGQSTDADKPDVKSTPVNWWVPVPYVRPDAKTRRSRYLKSTFGAWALGKGVIGAGISTWTNSPEEWGGQWKGFGKRVASNIGQRTIANTVVYGLDEAFKLDSHFYPSEKRDMRSRIGNAVISSVTARKASGKRTFGFPRILGIYTSSVVSRATWYPKRYTYMDGLRSGTYSVGMSVIYNLITEFMPKK